MPRKKQTAVKEPKKKVSRKASPAASRSKRKKSVTEDEFFGMIRQKAYDLYQKTGSDHGDDWNHWLKAEKDIKKQFSVKKSAR